MCNRMEATVPKYLVQHKTAFHSLVEAMGLDHVPVRDLPTVSSEAVLHKLT